MEAVEAIQLVADLVTAEDRGPAARALSASLGAEDLLVFLLDVDADALMPAPGWRKTLPGGDEWRELLVRSRQDGVHSGKVPWETGRPHLNVASCANDGLAIVFVGGEVSPADAQIMCKMAPLLKAALTAQAQVAATKGELQAALGEVRRASTLTQVLDDARSQLDWSLIELDRQARSLEQARARAEDATRAKDEFMAMLGHELRNPLAPIKTALDLLRLRGIWSQEHDVMQRQVSHMIRLVDDLLDVARIAGGKLTLHRAPTELASVIQRAVETASPLTTERRQSVHVVVEEGLCVLGDAPRLVQVFANLLTNASKYSDADKRIEVMAVRDGERVRVTVQDAGIGIDPAMLEDVFTLFHQQRGGLDRAQGGLGLGLAIVRNLVTLHDGTVTAHSDGPGHGSRFVVDLPVLADAPHAHAAQARTTAAIDARGKARILLVDDNDDARTTLAGALDALGHEVFQAADAFTAMALAQQVAPDVAVLDIGLPVLDGYELAKRLRQGPGPAMRLIALTGYGRPEDKARSRASGFHAHFTKPVNIEALLAAIELLTADEDAALPPAWVP